MDPQSAIQSQYLASLEMLKQAITRCPEAAWNETQDRNRFWHVAYHALFYTHLYLQEKAQDFKAWDRHTAGRETLSTPPEKLGESYSREALLDYLAICQAQVRQKVPVMGLDQPSGFHWLPFSKLELQFYNIRHLQQHTGELFERLGGRHTIELDWVSLVSETQPTPENSKE